MAARGKTTASGTSQTLLFGTGGVPVSAPMPRSTIGGIERLGQLGLDCMELEFVQQVKMGEETALRVRKAAKAAGIRLSAHAPYYINLNSPEPEKVIASQRRLLHAARIAWMCGAESIIFHAAFYMGKASGVVYAAVRKYLSEIVRELDNDGNLICLRPEVMGKASQFGTVDEVLALSSEFERVLPAFDVAHWHARDGGFNSYSEFVAAFRRIEDRLGRRGIENMHIHFSGIKYGKSGEIRHLNLQESDFAYVDMLKALRDCQARGLVICESPNLEADALLLKGTFTALSSSRSLAAESPQVPRA
jgi:deoxyribonuclease-4